MLLGKPSRFFLCAGAAEGYTPLNAFDLALLKAGVGNVNLIRLSSILPPGVTQIERVPLPPGGYVPIAYGTISSTTPQEFIAAAVAVAIPKNPELPGVIMEYSARGHKDDVERIVRSMAEEALNYREYEIDRIESISTEWKVSQNGAAFAGVVLVPEEFV